MKNHLLFVLIGVLLSSCSSTEKHRESEPPETIPTYEPLPSLPPAKIEEIIDLRALQTSLRMDTPRDVLGYREKKFNTCEVGAGYAASSNCRTQTLVVMSFQLMCRDSEGTVSEVVTRANLQPIANQAIRWTLSKASQEVLTDSDGYAQIIVVSSDTLRGQRLRLTSDNDFLTIQAGEIRSLIAPKNWCE